MDESHTKYMNYVYVVESCVEYASEGPNHIGTFSSLKEAVRAAMQEGQDEEIVWVKDTRLSDYWSWVAKDDDQINVTVTRAKVAKLKREVSVEKANQPEKPSMKLYFMDCSWAGSIAVVSSSKEEARKLMKQCENYLKEYPIGEYEIVEGLTLCNVGDLY